MVNNLVKLDCLRNIAAPDGVAESADMLQKRLDAQWDSDCSFEAEDPITGAPLWWEKFSKAFKVTQMVDVNGVPRALGTDFDDQADMCEIVRTLLANGYFPGADKSLKALTYDFLWNIFCPGDDGQTKVCAFNVNSFLDKSNWFVMFDSAIILFGGQPTTQLQQGLEPALH